MCSRDASTMLFASLSVKKERQQEYLKAMLAHTSELAG